jgi:hypothetical protein
MSHRRLLSLAAVAFMLALLSLHAAESGGDARSHSAPTAASPVSLQGTARPLSYQLGGQSARDIQRQAEQRAYRRQRRRIRRHGDAPAPVPRASAAQAPRVVARQGSQLPIVLALCALLALPTIASRLSSRRTS